MQIDEHFSTSAVDSFVIFPNRCTRARCVVSIIIVVSLNIHILTDLVSVEYPEENK